MKFFYILALIFGTTLIVQTPKPQKKDLAKENIKKQIEREKKYAKEQRFYSGKEYDLKLHEVDMKTVKSIPDVENTYEDYDMDHDYD